MDNFYMIFVDGKSAPSKRFEMLYEAEMEAERLCNKEKCNVYILKSVVKFELKNVEKTKL